MRRLLVLSPSSDLHGADRSLLNVLPALTDQFEVVLVSAAPGPLLERAEALGVQCHVVQDWALGRRTLRPAAVFAPLVRLRRVLRFLRSLHEADPFDIVYADTTATALLPLLRRSVGAPLVVHMCELPRDRPRQLAMLPRLGARSADDVIADSEFTVERYATQVAARLSSAADRRRPIVVLSPSTDLYGSDRALLHALPGVLARRPVAVAVADRGPFIDEAERLGATVVTLPDFAARRRYLRIRSLPFALVRWLRSLVAVRRLVKRCGAGLVYVNTVAVPLMPLLRVVTGARVLVHVHERALGGNLEQRLIGWAVRHSADLVVVNSAWTAGSLHPRTGPVMVVHNGVETAEPRSGVGSGKSLRLVCVARIHPKKGQWVLVDAVANAVAAGHDVEVDFVGDSLPEHADLERDLRAQVSARGIGDRVRFHGYRSDVDEFYRRADVVVVPSVAPEEFSLVAAEGQMRGLAAIVTGPGGVTEVVEEEVTGLVVAPDDVASLEAAIVRLARDRDLVAEYGRAGAARMLERFTLETYRSAIAEAVESAMAVGSQL